MSLDSTPLQPTVNASSARSLSSLSRRELDLLAADVYSELRALARQRFPDLRRGQDTLDTTALVSEVWLSLSQNKSVLWDRDDPGAKQYIKYLAALMMRRILLQTIREKQRLKRGGSEAKSVVVDHTDSGTELSLQAQPSAYTLETLLTLDIALTALEEARPQVAQVVECMFFGGLNQVETAQALELSRATVQRYWSFARAFLRLQFSEDVAG